MRVVSSAEHFCVGPVGRFGADTANDRLFVAAGGALVKRLKADQVLFPQVKS
jgi:hypothetical protein